MGINSRKVVVVGCGFVGSSSAFALMQSQLSVTEWYLQVR